MTKAQKVWEHLVRLRKPFTANEVSDKTGVKTDTVRNYFSYWQEKGAMEKTGKEEEIGKVGQPRARWSLLTRKFISVWRQN